MGLFALFKALTRRAPVEKPGSRGGKFYYDTRGAVHYGPPPAGEKGFGTLREFYAAHASWTAEHHTQQRIRHVGAAQNERPWINPTPDMQMHTHLGELHHEMARRKARGDRPFSDKLPLELHLGAARRIAHRTREAVEAAAAAETRPGGMADQQHALRAAGWSSVVAHSGVNTFRHPERRGTILVDRGGWSHHLHPDSGPVRTGTTVKELRSYLGAKTSAPPRPAPAPAEKWVRVYDRTNQTWNQVKVMGKGTTRMSIFGHWRRTPAATEQTGTLAKAQTGKKCPNCPCTGSGCGEMTKCGDTMHKCGEMAKCTGMQKALRHSLRDVLAKAGPHRAARRPTPRPTPPTSPSDLRPGHAFLDDERVHLVKAAVAGAPWVYSTQLLSVAARAARVAGNTALAARADAIRTRLAADTEGVMAKALVSLDARIEAVRTAFRAAFEPIKSTSPVGMSAYVMETYPDHVIALMPVGQNGADVMVSIPYVAEDTGTIVFLWGQRQAVQRQYVAA